MQNQGAKPHRAFSFDVHICDGACFKVPKEYKCYKYAELMAHSLTLRQGGCALCRTNFWYQDIREGVMREPSLLTFPLAKTKRPY